MTPFGSDRGALAIQAAVMVPLLSIIVLTMLFAGRLVDTNLGVQQAAHEAARAASLTTNPVAAAAAAQQSAQQYLGNETMGCAVLNVATNTTQFQPGGYVEVTVTCTTDLSDMAVLAVPGTKTFSATALEVVDTFRGGS